MEKEHPQGHVPTSRMKWAIIVVASVLLVVSTLYRLFNGQDADNTLIWAFTVVAGLVFGANIVDRLTKK